MQEIQLGDQAFAPWGNDGFLYPAVLVQHSGAQAHVAYLDGDESDVPADSLRQVDFGPGHRLQVNFKGGGTYYEGTVRQRLGMALFIDYDDGDRGWATLAQCRIPVDAAGSLPQGRATCVYCGFAVDASLSACPRCGGVRRG